MRGIVHKGLVMSLALALLAGPMLATTAEAGRRHRNRGHHQARHHVQRVYRDRHHGSHHYYNRGHHHHGSGIVPFLGGVALGAVIGSSRSYSPPPRVYSRVYVYDCGYRDCGYTCRDYDAWVNHLYVVHDVDRCDIDRYYPPYHAGYWEEY